MRSVKAVFGVLVFSIWSSASFSATASQTDKEQAALAGDSAIAYELFESAMAYNNVVDALFWIRVGAEHGDCKCIREIERMLRSSSRGPEAAAKWEARGKQMGCNEPVER
jgi:hypothetical protein